MNTILLKIKTKKLNSPPKEESLFPGYVFFNTNSEQYPKIRYRKGIKDIIPFNNNIAIINNDKVNQLKIIEKESYSKPIPQKVFVGQEAVIPEEPFKGPLIKIVSMPKKDRVNICFRCS